MKSWFAPLFLFLLLFCASCVPSSLSYSVPVTSYANNTDIPENPTILAKSPTPQEGVQEPTLIDVPFLSPTDIVPSLTPVTPESSPTATEIQPSATATIPATPEASPTKEGLWCNKDWIAEHIKVVQALAKNPDKVPILDKWSASITNFVNASPSNKQQCIGTSSKNSIVVSALKNWGFSDSKIENCRKKNIEPLLEENWDSFEQWFLQKNSIREFNVYVNDEGKEPYTCEWVISPLTSERRKELIDLMPKRLGLN